MVAKNFRYGFKAEASRFACELRAEMEVPLKAPLCPWKLAEHLYVPIINLTTLPDCEQRQYLSVGKGRNEFSATVCYDGIKAFVLNNDTHEPKRQASNIAHELAHVLLGHPPTAPFDEAGKRDFILEIEREAEWLGPALLVSDEAAMHAYRLIKTGQYSIAGLSDEWNVTRDVIQMRMNVVGASKRFGNRVA